MAPASPTDPLSRGGEGRGEGKYAALIAHARSTHPLECVGALFGHADQIEHTLPLINSSADPTAHFEVSAAEYLRAEREAERLGLDLLGFYHSHPHGPAYPSSEDFARCGELMIAVVFAQEVTVVTKADFPSPRPSPPWEREGRG